MLFLTVHHRSAQGSVTNAQDETGCPRWCRGRRTRKGSESQALSGFSLTRSSGGWRQTDCPAQWPRAMTSLEGHGRPAPAVEFREGKGREGGQKPSPAGEQQLCGAHERRQNRPQGKGSSWGPPEAQEGEVICVWTVGGSCGSFRATVPLSRAFEDGGFVSSASTLRSWTAGPMRRQITRALPSCPGPG